MIKRKPGRPKKNLTLDTSHLLTGVWILLEAINRYRTIAFDAKEAPSKSLKNMLLAFQHVIDLPFAKAIAEDIAAPPQDFTVQLKLINKYKKPLANIYKACKKRNKKGIRSVLYCETEIKELFRTEKGVKNLINFTNALTLTQKEIENSKNQAATATDKLGKALGVGSRRKAEDLLKMKTLPRTTPTLADGDIFSREALGQLLIVSGYSRKVAAKVIDLLDNDDQFMEQVNDYVSDEKLAIFENRPVLYVHNPNLK